MSHKHRAEVIEVYHDGMQAAVRFTSGRIECVRNLGTSPSGERVTFAVGQRGMVDYVRALNGYEWIFTPAKKQRSTHNYAADWDTWQLEREKDADNV